MTRRLLLGLAVAVTALPFVFLLLVALAETCAHLIGVHHG